MLTILNSSHLDLCLDLAKNNPGLHKLGNEFYKIITPTDFFNRILTNDYTVGWIENNQLLSISSMRLDGWHWIWDFYGCIKLPYTDWNATKGHLVISNTFQESLKLKLGAVFYTCRDNFPTISSDASGSLKKKLLGWQELIPETTYYHWVDAAKIPTGYVPMYDWQQRIIGDLSVPVPRRLRLGILKQEYREKYIL
jgi:hypothetical protein